MEPIKKEKRDQERTLPEKMKEVFYPGSIKTRSRTKELVGEIYKMYGVKGAPKATDLSHYGINYRETFTRDQKTGKTVSVFRIEK